MTRSYDMTKRAQAAEDTARRIVDATEALLGAVRIDDVTLQAIADGADVTVQTVLRHMGSRDGCFEAVGRRVAARIDAQRSRSRPGDVDGAVADLVAHYEAEGRLVLNLLAQEAGQHALAREAASQGRDYHRAWVERCFGPHIPEHDSEVVDALVAATDLYVWKLLRLDLGRSVAATEATLGRMVRSLLEEACVRS